MMVTPCFFSLRMMSNRRRTSAMASVALGSSMMRTLMFWERARAISTICCCATERLPTMASTGMDTPRDSKISLVRRRISLRSNMNLPPTLLPRNTFWVTERDGTLLNS